MPSLPVLAFLLLAAFMAGFVDAAVGGGGLIQLPALLIAFPYAPTTTLLGTNKVVSCTGTSFAAAQFIRSKVLHWHEMVGPVLAAMVGALVGASLTYTFQKRFDVYFQPAMVILMVLMLAFTLLKPDLGHMHAPRFGLRHQRGLSIFIALFMGVYDGFFGPGMGTLLIFLFVAILGFDFIRASALAKSVNWASNAAAVVLFLAKGSWLPVVALSMAMANGLGGHLGARTALAKGNRWVRLLFIVVVSALILRLGWQTLFKP